MSKHIVFMFSGQGSQYFQMGKDLYEHHTLFKFWMDQCDKIASPLIQTSLIDILYRGKGKSEPFDRLLHTNPALLSIEYCLANVLKEMGVEPDFLLGYSLGEITASVVSGAMSLEDGIRLVVGMAKLVEDETQVTEMLAIMGAKNVIDEFPDLFRQCWITGTNFQDNFVICGSPEVVQKIQRSLNSRNVPSQVLPLKYGFHTELIDPIEEKYKQIIRGIKKSHTEIPIISSLKGELVYDLNEDYFWKVIRYPVDFKMTVDWILKKGDFVFIDSGPSGSLATFVKYILSSDSGSLALPIINPFGNDLNSLKKLKNSLFADA